MPRATMSSFWQTLPRPITALAPMEDVTDTVFRRIVAGCGRPGVFFTEFTNADGLCSVGREAVIHRLRFTEEERPIVAQIWGNNPENYLRVCREICDMGFDGIDINMGCPEKRVVKQGACSALIDNPTLATELVRAAQEGAGELPVSVKTRLGFRSRRTELWSETLLRLHPAVLTMHGRTAKELSEVPADWGEIAKVVELRDAMGSDTLIIGNGDVTKREQIPDFCRDYGVDGVMIGRGIFHDLFIFRPPETEGAFRDLPPREKLRHLREHVLLFREVWGEGRNVNILKKFVKVYVTGFAGAAGLRAELMETTGYDELLARIALASWSLSPS